MQFPFEISCKINSSRTEFQENLTAGKDAVSFSKISFRVIRLEKQVVNADLIKVRQLYQQLIRQLLGSSFDIAVFPLGNADGIRNPLLSQVVILPQIPDSVLHI